MINRNFHSDYAESSFLALPLASCFGEGADCKRCRLSGKRDLKKLRDLLKSFEKE
jgi:hypothetical protein